MQTSSADSAADQAPWPLAMCPHEYVSVVKSDHCFTISRETVNV